MKLHVGEFIARAVDGRVGESEKNGTPYVSVRFRVEEGDCKDESIFWTGWLTERTVDRTTQSLEYCGWDGRSLRELAGITRNLVRLVVDEELGTDGKKRLRVSWVNSLGPKVKAVHAGKLADLEDLVQASRLARAQARQTDRDASAGYRSGNSDDDIPF